MLIHNATVITFNKENKIIQSGAIHITNGVIDAIGKSSSLLAQYPNDERWDANGLVLMPGQICAHTHIYGAFARGMYIPGTPAKNFPEILKKLWWPLDKALDLEGVRSSAEVCLVDAIRHGTTTLIDHHASQTAIDGSLDVLSDMVYASGLRAVLCYEVTDRDGPEAAKAGIQENVRFQKKVSTSDLDSRLAATFGLHASMTLSNETLEHCQAEAKLLNSGFHIHVGEHPADSDDCNKRYGIGLVTRLRQYGITGPNSIFAHCIHIDEDERQQLVETDTWVTHQPRSNMNNAVGAAQVCSMLEQSIGVSLGNDGFSNDMFAEMKVADLLHKVVSGDPRTLGADKVVQMAVQNNRSLASLFFDKRIGTIELGAYADLILLDYYPTTPLTAENLPWHILFGMSGSHVHSTIVQGKVLMKNRELTTVDEEEITSRSREAAAQTWERFEALVGG
ncbi:MAG: putative aminohydrolase SsnA [Chloroflexota bacterium]